MGVLERAIWGNIECLCDAQNILQKKKFDERYYIYVYILFHTYLRNTTLLTSYIIYIHTAHSVLHGTSS